MNSMKLRFVPSIGQMLHEYKKLHDNFGSHEDELVQFFKNSKQIWVFGKILWRTKLRSSKDVKCNKLVLIT